MFLDMQDKEPQVTHFGNHAYHTYLSVVFDQLKKLNLKLQGKDTTELNFVDTLRVFVTFVAGLRKLAQVIFLCLRSFLKLLNKKK